MTLFRNVDILDGDGWRRGVDITVDDGRIADIRDSMAIPGARVISPGLVDLQVNGGGGLMLGDCRTPEDIGQIVLAHRRLGTTHILPTLISDSFAATARVIELLAKARLSVPGLSGLHLEGPHLAIPGAHDPGLLRPMNAEDLALYLKAKTRLGTLMITLAPEQVSLEQISTLAEAGVIVALGHGACTYDDAIAAFEAGARMATHLFNAMSGLHHRAPGLAGAALDRAEAFGLIADGHHLHDAGLRLAARARPDAVLLVSDAMAVAGTGAKGFALNGRQITRKGGQLTLSDGTLAGADTSLLHCALYLAKVLDVPPVETLPYAFDAPWRLLTGSPNRIAEGDAAAFFIGDRNGLTLFDLDTLHHVALPEHIVRPDD
ncbi:N-acetylglucosamine-6-phosphate deacetylase [Rhodophyticola sp. CCM32]|uniref:N-acetylglucosamine-6-phosphate deacetylase n=1 Tax=Rhodophyticola sp. CCM32 TaxID=2916397 RepID=UPI00107F2EB4|nr:N-acetylglucosamine-6-phosphate deacetylase [Rhodophyticola sp. CCM32]QBY00659.1 N-acetylglucosamine-6-phosphate deacetylase [Rhodophyticola sp. CCM32]